MIVDVDGLCWPLRPQLVVARSKSSGLSGLERQTTPQFLYFLLSALGGKERQVAADMGSPQAYGAHSSHGTLLRPPIVGSQ